MAAPGVVYFVGTPIGNLADITQRALDTLRSVDLIACEDTRHSARLLNHYDIRNIPRLSLHEHNEAKRSDELIKKIQAGSSVAVISDAGMPTISDPGQRLLQRLLAHDLPYEIIPGPSAPIAALVGAGLPADHFAFHGFLPPKKGARERELTTALEAAHTSVFFESPHRLLSTLEILARLDPNRLICVARELTKKFEEFHRSHAAQALAHFQDHPPKGEIVLLIAGTKLPKWLHLPDPNPSHPAK
ncbi:MAG: 16S rRNA (cytidine(1402)-2'-O)-methyltransferase [Verrucomicrobiota bacterium]